jgi:hypothetical protein
LGKEREERSQWESGLKRLAAVAGKPEHWFFMEEDQERQRGHRISAVELDVEKEQALLSLFNHCLRLKNYVLFCIPDCTS